MCGLKLVSTTPEGRMNSMSPPPRLLMPRGKVPRCRNPMRAPWPRSSGRGGVKT